ncbi:MAG: hypothetical protein UW23_C0016G0021 [Candidatus Collierbacteria bacterium GW2011_GWA1_44_12]|uniref:Uncharacterized protein n=1 Tax=Candidatus Collierbacteria bacterium GW2011_GWA1_44_12 TaxID=1618376 RepID=A0A0G1GLM0_9BACT|nr:MAG: hypothetical protein UW23_C0016G0021 [Candidatus Collierbacteria bacterium GW2011_GWA1_44_12]
MEPVQIVILIVIVVLTILLAALGVQVFFILREIRRTIEKANKVLDDAGVITESIATPVSTLSSLAMSIKTGVSFAGWIKKTYEHLINHLPHKETKDQHEKQTQKDQGQGGAVSIPEEYWAIPLDDEMIGFNLIKYIESLDIKDHWVLFHFSAYNIWTYYDKKGIPHYYDQDGDRLIPG